MHAWEAAVATTPGTLVSCCVCKLANYTSLPPEGCPQMSWVTAEATLESATALREGMQSVPRGSAYRDRVDRSGATSWLLGRCADMCAYTRARSIARPLAPLQ